MMVKKNVLGKRRHIENALQLLENYNHINGHQILQNNDMSYVKLALSVYEKAIEINDSVFENSKPKEHIRIYIFEQQV